MRNIIKRVLTLFVVVGLLCSIQVGLAVNKFSAQTVTESEKTNVVKSASGIKSYDEYKLENSGFEYADEDVVIAGDNYSSENNSNVEKLAQYEGKSNVLKWDSQKGSVTYEMTVPKDGIYNINLTYMQLPCQSKDIQIGLKIDSKYLFDGMETVFLPRLWTNKGEVRVDDKGDQISPEQAELSVYTTQLLTDKEGVAVKPYEFALTAGKHTITIEMQEEAFVLASIALKAPQSIESYKEISANYKESDYYKGSPIVIEGEDANIKTSNSLIPKSDNSVSVTPSNPRNLMINYIGSKNWSSVGQVLTWKVNIKQSGLYKLAFKFKQSDLVNGISYRSMKVDGEIPFVEAQVIAFGYKTNWQVSDFADENNNPYLIYLSKGDHEISFDVTLAETAEFYSRLKEMVTEIGDLYIKINMITGETPDANRNYDLFKQIPEFNETLKELYEGLDKLSEDMKKQSGKRSNSVIAAIANMSRVLKSMYDNPYTSHQYKADYYTNYTSLSSWLYEMKSMPLSIDQILLTAPDYHTKSEKVGLFKSFAFGVLRYIYSFALDYADISSSESENTIKVWANIGRDQAQIIQTLIRDDFTPKTNIEVNFQAVNATVVKGVLSGNPPDIEMNMARTEPVNLAMRGVLYDVSKFDDYNEVKERFQKTAMTPYEYNGGVYALPATQAFYIMYYREDIFKQLGLTVPTTWEEFKDCAITIQRNKMQVWLPYTQIQATTTVNVGIGGLSIFPTLMAQNGLSLFNKEFNGSNLNTKEAISVFNTWTDFYTEYKIPKEASFYNRFRVGTMPLGIDTYLLYQTLNSAAPEIKGRWKIAPLPGVINADNTINNSSTGSGTGNVIIKGTGKEELAWEFLKWWTSADIQVRYSNNLESILGPVGRIDTANVEALSRLSWTKKDLGILMEQWEKVVEVNEIPGSYYLTRALDQAFWNVTNGQATSKDAILEWSMVADNEIKRKIEEYGTQPKEKK